MLIYTRHEKNVETNQEEKNELEKEHTSVSQELKDMKMNSFMIKTVSSI